MTVVAITNNIATITIGDDVTITNGKKLGSHVVASDTSLIPNDVPFCVIWPNDKPIIHLDTDVSFVDVLTMDSIFVASSTCSNLQVRQAEQRSRHSHVIIISIS